MMAILVAIGVVLHGCCLAKAEQWPTQPTNLGFEEGTNSWLFPKALWRVSDGEGRGGSKAIVWENSDSKRYLYPRQTLSLEVGGIYRFGAWVKVDSLKAGKSDKPKPRVSLDYSNVEGKWIGADYAHPVSKPDADGWVRYECVTGPLGVDVVRGNLFGFLPRGSTGRVRFDDFWFSQEGTRRVDNMVSSAYRDTADSGPVTFVATLFIDPAKLPADLLSPVFVFRTANGVETEVAPEAFDAVHAAVTLDVSRLAVGAHPVTFILRAKADGKELGRISRTFTRAAVRRRVSFDRFGRTLVEGKPFFPLGMYARDVTPEVLALYTNGTPYNCIMPYHMPSNAMLDVCRDAGLMVICSVKDFVYGVHTDHEKFRSREDSLRHIAGMVRSAKNHPATLAWYTNDESPPRQVAIQRDLRSMIHDLDPDHPVWHVTDRKNKIAPFLGAYDVIGMDPYPVGREGELGDIGRASGWVRDVQECAFGTVPVWHVPQAFNWAWDTHRPRSKLHRYPTTEELVSMTWQPIAAGANGLIYYAFHRICMGAKPEERDEFLRRAAVAAEEVKAKIPLILSDPGPKVESVPQGMVCRTWEYPPGRVTLLAANATRDPVSGDVTLAGLPPQAIELPPLGHAFIELKADMATATLVDAVPAPADRGGELAPLAFEAFPAGTIAPRGWLRHQLEMQTEGLQGRLYETSEFLTEDNGWLKPDKTGWEEQAYWLRTFVKLAILTQNKRMLDVSARWIDGVIAAADKDGWFGPRELRNHKRAANDGTICHDIWPHMVMTEALMTWYDYRRDARIPELMANFARWCNRVPYDVLFLADSRNGSWHYAVQTDRTCDIVPSLFRLYSMTGDKAFLEFADRCFRYRKRTTARTYLDSHNVNFAQRFAYETIYSRRSRNAAHRAFADYWFDLNALCWGGEMPRWSFASDECARVGCFDARYATETCTWGELTRSFQQLGSLTGDPKWGDRIEDVVFNDYPVAFSPDWKKVHYLTAPNQVSLDAATDHNYQKPPPRLAYSSKLYRCCRHNAGLTLPLFAEKLTQRTPGGDLVFFAYAPHSGRDGNVEWTLDTRYPFRESFGLSLKNADSRAVYLRVPGWAKRFTVRRGGKVVFNGGKTCAYLKLYGPWGAEETLDVEMKAECVFSPHVRSHAVTIERGPLSYSLAIKEHYREVPMPSFKADEKGVLESHFPEAADAHTDELMLEVLPQTPWNYALELEKAPRYVERAWSDDCFVSTNVPCEIVAWGRRVPEWTLQDGQPAELQESPVRTSEPEERIRFIPMGAARCRLTVLPTVGHVEMQSYKWGRTPPKTSRANRPRIISQ